ncbi:MAG: LptE family protein [Flavobacteriales bacterium]|nr:LptE family protein [Flavobacteriales bacterium]
MKYVNILSLTVCILISCKVRYSFSGGSVPAEAKTFSVSYFSVRANLADPNYGQNITEGLKDLLLDQTPLGLSDNDGDIHYEGEVTRYEVIPVAASGEEISTRNRLNVELKVRYYNRIEPEKDKQLTLRQFEDFEASEEFSSIEEDLLDEINSKILQDIYDQTLGDW